MEIYDKLANIPCIPRAMCAHDGLRRGKKRVELERATLVVGRALESGDSLRLAQDESVARLLYHACNMEGIIVCELGGIICRKGYFCGMVVWNTSMYKIIEISRSDSA